MPAARNSVAAPFLECYILTIMISFGSTSHFVSAGAERKQKKLRLEREREKRMTFSWKRPGDK